MATVCCTVVLLLGEVKNWIPVTEYCGNIIPAIESKTLVRAYKYKLFYENKSQILNCCLILK